MLKFPMDLQSNSDMFLLQLSAFLFYSSTVPLTTLSSARHYVDTCVQVEEIRAGRFTLNCGRRREAVMDKRWAANINLPPGLQQSTPPPPPISSLVSWFYYIPRIHWPFRGFKHLITFISVYSPLTWGTPPALICHQRGVRCISIFPSSGWEKKKKNSPQRDM